MAKSRKSVSGHTAGQLSDLTGVSPRTLRSWIAQGVLPKPQGRGRGARYSDTHVQLARAIVALRRQGVPLAQMNLKLAQLDKRELDRLARADRPSPQQPPPPPEPSYPSVPWEVVQLMPGMLLMVSPAKGPVLRRIADEIYQHYSVKP